MRQISIAIPTYNRTTMLFEAFDKVKDNDAISEIVIVDDASDGNIYSEIQEKAKRNPKIKLYRNERNLDCYFNKCAAICQCTNEWAILLDSDNIIDFNYLYRISQVKDWDAHTIYAPDFAMPAFNYERFSGLEITRSNVATYMDEPMFEVCLNTCNFFVNRDSYMEIWDGSVDPVTSDSIYFCMKWLEAGYKIQIVSGLRYEHRLHDNSHYNSNRHRTPDGFHQSILNKLKSMV